MVRNRYKELVLKADEGITFKISEGEDGQVIIRALNHFGKGSVYSQNYVNPPVPEGYKHVEGKWYNGFVIERRSDGSQFVWIPVGYLNSDGTLDGDVFIEKFGRRNYMSHKYNQKYGYIYAEDEFSDEGYHEELSEELLEQLESVKKYGGFYISRYNISQGMDGKPQSIKGVKPWVDLRFAEVKELAASMEENEAIKSHLTYGAEYDSVLEWFIESKARTVDEVVKEDSKAWGYHCEPKPLPPYNIPGGNYEPITIVETGSSEAWCTNNIYDFAGNVGEWTQEQYGEECDEDECQALRYDNHVIRGNCYRYHTSDSPVAYRNDSGDREYTGFRVVLCIK